MVAAHFIDKLNANHGDQVQQFKGVVFFASKTAGLPKSIEHSGWHVMDKQKCILSKNRSPIHEADAFVLFDEARCRCGPSHDAETVLQQCSTVKLLPLCRGSDMKLKPNAKAILTLGPGMCRDKLMQAAMRMRQLEHSQTLTLVPNSEVSRCFRVHQCCLIPISLLY